MICKKALVVGAIMGLGAPALYADDKDGHSVKVKGYVRGQLEMNEHKVKGGKTEKDYNGFKLHTADVELTGEVGSCSFYTNASLALIGAESDTVDGSPAAIDLAYLSHKFGSNITLTVGKMQVNLGSVENLSYISYDRYFDSGLLTADGFQLRGVGAMVGGTFGDHWVGLQFVNGIGHELGDATGAKNEVKGGMTTTLAYKGNISNMIKPVVSYGMVKSSDSKYDVTSGTTTTTYKPDKAGNTVIGVGAQVETAGATIDLEYDTMKVPTRKVVDAAGTETDEGKDQTHNTIVFQAKYLVSSINLVPWLKVTSDTHDTGADADAGNTSVLTYGAGAEWWASKHLRYFAAYNVANITIKKTPPATEDTEATATQILLGGAAAI